MSTQDIQSIYLVDTSAWIFALRRRPVEAVRRRIDELLDLDAVSICGLVEIELLGGAANDVEFGRLQRRLAGLRRLPIGEADWRNAARLAFTLRRQGVTIPFTDALLAVIAQQHGAVLVHADRDFDLLARASSVQVESLADLVSPP